MFPSWRDLAKRDKHSLRQSDQDVATTNWFEFEFLDFYPTSMQRLGWVLEGLGKSIKKETNTVCYGFAEKSYHCQRFILCFFSCSFSSSSFILLFLYVGDRLQHWFQESSIARFISGIIKRILFGFALYRKSIFHSCFFLYHTLSLSKTLSYG